MAKTDGSKKKKFESTPEGGDIHVGGNVTGNDIVIGHNNVIHKYYQIIEKNTKQNDPDFWNLKHPYPMPPNFTGRLAERAMLTQWLDGDSENRLFILRALGGFGKSALAWQWLTHDTDPTQWTKVLWWSFYEGDASFEHFIEETLKYLKLEVPQGQRPQVDELLKAMGDQKILLILDGFERALRAYSSMNAAYQGDDPKVEEYQLDCVNINAEIFLKSVCSLPNIKSKVLMSTRLTPRCIKPRGEFMLGCRETELTAMQKTDAVEFFRKQKIKGTHTEIKAACEPYGYHPLSLRLLAGRILKDFENPADIVVAQKLKIDGDIIQQKHHVLEVSYNSLPPHEQKLLSTIACFRSAVEHKTLNVIAESLDPSRKLLLKDDLHDLLDRGLLYFDKEAKKFDLHPIVRHFAYDHMTAIDRTDTHKNLVNYFDAVPKPQKAEKLEDFASTIELYHHMIKTGEYDVAFRILHDQLIPRPLHFLGLYQLSIELVSVLFIDKDYQTPILENELMNAWLYNSLANSHSLSGQSYLAASLFETHNIIRQKQDNKYSIAVSQGNLAFKSSGLPRNSTTVFQMDNIVQQKQENKYSLAIGLGNLALDQIRIGRLREAEQNLNRRIDLSREIDDKHSEAIGHREIGRIFIYMGKWKEAHQKLYLAESLFSKEKMFSNKYSSGQAVTCSYFALSGIIHGRSNKKDFDIDEIDRNLTRASIYRFEWIKFNYPIEREDIHNSWLSGAARRFTGELYKSEERLTQAIIQCRQINLVEMEANILLDLAHLRYDQKNYEEAKNLVDEALLITERCGYVLTGADVNLFLAQYALEQEKDNAKAKVYAEEAKKLATCDGPPYYYKVAYDEAVKMLEGLNV